MGEMEDKEAVQLVKLLRAYRDHYGENLAELTAQDVHDDLIGSLPADLLREEGLIR